MDEDALSALLAPRFEAIRMWKTADVRSERSDLTWLNCLATKR